MIGNHGMWPEEQRQHLSPTGVGLAGLVCHRRVAGQEDPSHGRISGERFHRHMAHASRSPEKLERQPFVPVRRPHLARLQRHRATRKLLAVHVHKKRFRNDFSPGNPFSQKKEPPGLAFAGCHALGVVAATLNRDPVHALGQRAREADGVVGEEQVVARKQ